MIDGLAASAKTELSRYMWLQIPYHYHFLIPFIRIPDNDILEIIYPISCYLSSSRGSSFTLEMSFEPQH